ncbi:MAG: YgiQ family radical SAM protein [candidate division KSB1 bacterium]|nr:YgiQ family radical SAM protein [candidate division KSB1 bacterium]MDZ7346199.1 YgiQ family radical SAM protein [candidate division KSB1 bacterium]
MFLPVTREEMKALGWEACDVILVTGDAYIDSPHVGIAVIGKWLAAHGFRVGVIPQPRLDTDEDILRLGEPTLFWGVTGGCIDSMVANYTALNKRRRSDDYTPGGVNNRRPDRAVIVYSNLIRRYCKGARIVLGGIEAGLRRVAHYDYWSDSIRRSILFDAKADVLIYGMGEQTALQLAQALRRGEDWHRIRGLCYIDKKPPTEFVELPSFEQVAADVDAFIDMFHLFYRNQDPLSARGLFQQHGDRFFIHNPPAPLPSPEKLDRIYELDYERELHPFHRLQGEVRALETIRFSITTHRGCYGECTFCAIAVHQGRTVVSRSEASILREVEALTRHPRFRGVISDLGGPTANMYGFECDRKWTKGVCLDRRCIGLEVCPRLKPNHRRQIELLRAIRRLPKVKKVFVASGIRYDLLSADTEFGDAYLHELAAHHVSGQLKVAPEHSEPSVLTLMNKPAVSTLLEFKRRFEHYSKAAGKQQFLTYYLIAAFPGCSDAEMMRLKRFVGRELRLTPEQVQIFTPTPGTWGSVMYVAEKDPFTGARLFVEKSLRGKARQKQMIVSDRNDAGCRRASSERSSRGQRR